MCSVLDSCSCSYLIRFWWILWRLKHCKVRFRFAFSVGKFRLPTKVRFSQVKAGCILINTQPVHFSHCSNSIVRIYCTSQDDCITGWLHVMGVLLYEWPMTDLNVVFSEWLDFTDYILHYEVSPFWHKPLLVLFVSNYLFVCYYERMFLFSNMASLSLWSSCGYPEWREIGMYHC